MAPSKPKAQSCESEETLHATATATTPRVWSREEEIVILEGMLKYKEKFGMIPTSSSAHVEPLHALISDSLSMEASTNQLSQKMRSLRKKHLRNAHRKPTNKRFFKLSNKIWGPNKSPTHPSMASFIAASARISESGGDMETHFIEEGLKFLQGPERAMLEERWAKWRNAQVALAVERAQLIHEQAMLVHELEGNKVADQD